MREEEEHVGVQRDFSLGNKTECFRPWCKVERAAVLIPLHRLQRANMIHPLWASPHR